MITHLFQVIFTRWYEINQKYKIRRAWILYITELTNKYFQKYSINKTPSNSNLVHKTLNLLNEAAWIVKTWYTILTRPYAVNQLLTNTSNIHFPGTNTPRPLKISGRLFGDRGALIMKIRDAARSRWDGFVWIDKQP